MGDYAYKQTYVKGIVRPEKRGRTRHQSNRHTSYTIADVFYANGKAPGSLNRKNRLIYGQQKGANAVKKIFPCSPFRHSPVRTYNISFYQ